MQQPALLHCKPQLLSPLRTNLRLQTRHTRPLRIRRGWSAQALQQQNGGLADTAVKKYAPPWVSHPAFFLAATAGFGALATDLFAPWGGRLLFEAIDKPTHLWVVGHLPKVVRDLVFEIGVSNVSITLGCAGWALCTSILLSDAMEEKSGGKIHGVSLPAEKAEGSHREGLQQEQPGGAGVMQSLGSKNFKRLLAIWVMNFTVGGFLGPRDNFFVRYIKHVCGRARPSSRYSSFSFPSGHATAVTFIVGMLLFAMLPYLLEVVEARMGEPNRTLKLGVLSGDGPQRLLRSVVRNGGKLWGVAIACTAGGRVLGDVHWVTDTAAGALLGSAIVSAYLIASSGLEARKDDGVA